MACAWLAFNVDFNHNEHIWFDSILSSVLQIVRDAVLIRIYSISLKCHRWTGFMEAITTSEHKLFCFKLLSQHLISFHSISVRIWQKSVFKIFSSNESVVKYLNLDSILTEKIRFYICGGKSAENQKKIRIITHCETYTVWVATDFSSHFKNNGLGHIIAHEYSIIKMSS